MVQRHNQEVDTCGTRPNVWVGKLKYNCFFLVYDCHKFTVYYVPIKLADDWLMILNENILFSL